MNRPIKVKTVTGDIVFIFPHKIRKVRYLPKKKMFCIDYGNETVGVYGEFKDCLEFVDACYLSGDVRTDFS